jgi:hypothetical protein
MHLTLRFTRVQTNNNELSTYYNNKTIKCENIYLFSVQIIIVNDNSLVRIDFLKNLDTSKIQKQPFNGWSLGKPNMKIVR